MNPLSVIMSLVVLAAVGALIWHFHGPKPPPPPPAEPNEFSGMLSYPELLALSNRTKSLQAQKRYGEVAVGMRALMHQHDLQGKLVSDMVAEYGQMLSNAAFESGAHAPRSSVERMAYERKSLETFQRALAMAKTPRDRAKVVEMIGFVAEMWGFPYDAYLSYRAAAGIDPTLAEAQHDVARFTQHRGPVTPVAGP